jgi:hypothetical protein
VHPAPHAGRAPPPSILPETARRRQAFCLQCFYFHFYKTFPWHESQLQGEEVVKTGCSALKEDYSAVWQMPMQLPIQHRDRLTRLLGLEVAR